jgi:hypothetical protein
MSDDAISVDTTTTLEVHRAEIGRTRLSADRFMLGDRGFSAAPSVGLVARIGEVA